MRRLAASCAAPRYTLCKACRTLVTSREDPTKDSAGRPRAKLVNGRALAIDILREVMKEVEYLKENFGQVPGLACIQVGDRKDSAQYVNMKRQVAATCGFNSFCTELPATVQHQQVLEVIDRYNHDERVHGILLQLPLPQHLDPRALLGAVRIEKDVECFHPANLGRLSAWRRTVISPCTARGVMEVLRRLGIDVKGKHAAVVGESNVVGLPTMLMLNAARATVTVVHEDSPHPEELVRRADIVVVATGVPGLVKRHWIKPGAVVIDVGINFLRDDSKPEGFRIVGDVDPSVRQVAGVVTPVPGGLGPITVAMLMRNCLDVALLRSRFHDLADALHEGHSAENARRMQGAVLDLALGEPLTQQRQGKKQQQQQQQQRFEQAGEQAGGAYAVAGSGGGGVREGAAADVEVEEGKGDAWQDFTRGAIERLGRGISDAQLLTIINDSEKNAYSVLGFLELGLASRHRSVETMHEQRRELPDLPEKTPLRVPVATKDAIATAAEKDVAQTRRINGEEQRCEVIDALRSEAAATEAAGNQAHRGDTWRLGEEAPLMLVEDLDESEREWWLHCERQIDGPQDIRAADKE